MASLRRSESFAARAAPHSKSCVILSGAALQAERRILRGSLQFSLHGKHAALTANSPTSPGSRPLEPPAPP
jgi:hypothetical protein